jgi:hypothetical protein
VGRGLEVSARAGVDTVAGELTPYGVGGAPFEPVHQRRDREGGRVVHEQVHVVASPLNSTNSASRSAQPSRMVCSHRLSIGSVKIGRLYLVTNTRCACSSDTLWRARR